MSKSTKIWRFVIMVMLIIAALAYGIMIGDPQDMQIEASGL